MMRILVAFGWCIAAASAAVAQEPPPFDAALQAHLEAVQARDLAAFEATITRASGMTLIFPDGRALGTRREVLDLHREWFAEAGWTWEPEVVTTTVGTDLAYALVRYRYGDPAGSRENWLSLVFRLEAGKWRLVHDQNTRVGSGDTG
jgi:ketosteroid isomerase-like protein